MRNYFGGLHQFATNISGLSRIAVVADVVLSGQNSYLAQLDYFLGTTASQRDIVDAIYLGPPLSPVEARDWPFIPNLTTWCFNPPPNGAGRDDLVSAPPGFVLARPGYMMPVFLHHGTVIARGSSDTSGSGASFGFDAAVHLVGGLSRTGKRDLPGGGLEISIGTYPFSAAIVEMQLSDTGMLQCSTTYWNIDAAPHNTWPLD